MENNKTLKKAKEKLSKMSEDEYMQRIAEWREKAILDENTNKRDAYENGVKDGIEQGRAQGIEQGIAQGIEQGIAQGNKMAKIELVKNMLKENVPTETISKISKLNKEEIEKIKKNIKD